MRSIISDISYLVMRATVDLAVGNPKAIMAGRVRTVETTSPLKTVKYNGGADWHRFMPLNSAVPVTVLLVTVAVAGGIPADWCAIAQFASIHHLTLAPTDRYYVDRDGTRRCAVCRGTRNLILARRASDTRTADPNVAPYRISPVR
jgi:hypothetical protein